MQNRAFAKKTLPRPTQTQLNALEAVDYEAVMKAKMAFVREIFPAQRKENFASADYRKFFAQNRTLARALRGVLFFARQIWDGGFPPVAGTPDL